MSAKTSDGVVGAAWLPIAIGAAFAFVALCVAIVIVCFVLRSRRTEQHKDEQPQQHLKAVGDTEMQSARYTPPDGQDDTELQRNANGGSGGGGGETVMTGDVHAVPLSAADVAAHASQGASISSSSSSSTTSLGNSSKKNAAGRDYDSSSDVMKSVNKIVAGDYGNAPILESAQSIVRVSSPGGVYDRVNVVDPRESAVSFDSKVNL